MENKPQQLELPFDKLLEEVAQELNASTQAAPLICFNTARLEQHVLRVHRDLMRRGFGLVGNDELMVG
jgi:hypothetical protein